MECVGRRGRFRVLEQPFQSTQEAEVRDLWGEATQVLPVGADHVDLPRFEQSQPLLGLRVDQSDKAPAVALFDRPGPAVAREGSPKTRRQIAGGSAAFG